MNSKETGNNSNRKVMPDVKTEAEVIRILGGEDEDEITALHYGPYDNGYILVGLSSGKLLVYDSITLSRVKEFNVFTQV